MSANPNEDNEEGAAFDPHAVLLVMREKWWLVLLCMLFTIGLGIFYISVTPKTYLSEATVQVEQSPSKILDIQDVTQEDLKEQEVLKTIEARLTSVEDLSNIINRLKLTPKMLGMKPRTPPFTDENPHYTPEEIVAALSDQVTAKLTRGTRLIVVTAANQDKRLAQQICTNLIAEYIRSDMAERAGISGEANRFLLEQADMLKQRVSIAEQAAQDFKDAHPGVELDEAETSVDEKLRDFANHVTDAQQTRIRLEADNDQVQKILAKGNSPDQTIELLTVPSVAADPDVLQIQKSISDEQAIFASVKQRYLPKHPNYIQEESKIAGLKSSLQTAVLQAAKSLTTSVQAARQAEAKINGILDEQKKGRVVVDKLQIPYNALVREVNRNLDLYNSVLERLKETDLTTNMDESKIATISPASLPYTAYKPKRALILLGCFIFGGLLSVAACFAISMSDESVRTIDEAEEALGMKAVGAIPLGEKLTTIEEGIAILREPDGPIAESFRTLRAALGLLDEDGSNRVFLFTSGVPGEGKSYCSINYAISLAQLARKTLLRLDAFSADACLGRADLFQGKESQRFVDAHGRSVGFGRLLLSDRGAEPVRDARRQAFPDTFGVDCQHRFPPLDLRHLRRVR